MEKEILEEYLPAWRRGTLSWPLWKLEEYAYEEACRRCERAIRMHNDQVDLRKKKRGEAL